jgi:hypothetical protein
MSTSPAQRRWSIVVAAIAGGLLAQRRHTTEPHGPERTELTLSRRSFLHGLAAMPVLSAMAARPAIAASASSWPSGGPVALKAGEALVYDVKFGLLDVGTARMEVLGTETVRGRDAWHTRFAIAGSALGFGVRDVLESWIDVETGDSLRYRQDSVEGSKRRSRLYEIKPESGVYQRAGDAELPTVAQPLDQGAFMYFLRGQPLEIGRSYSYPRYFVPERNPVSVSVLRREQVRVPAGAFDAIVLRPILKTPGAFSEQGRAEIWLSNDERRWLVRMVTRLKFGTLALELRQARA